MPAPAKPATALGDNPPLLTAPFGTAEEVEDADSIAPMTVEEAEEYSLVGLGPTYD
jgi:hypothetical protein